MNRSRISLALALAALAALVMVLELLGPVVTQRALRAARETHVTHDEN